ncbi:RNase H-like domain found in reverse transcriptase [Phytophthora infestans]|uniref:RNA-directed DNA polymerase n=1 Tax=Phytophthora infestans TaxID=4787 RepID=A0A8S9TMZ0_PHYIN|nr:RNase H-like domain found in reverse transcriptase [Phytophthora infestans]
MLKVDLTRLVEMTHREAKMNDLALHDLMIERATRQQQYHLMQAEMKQTAGDRPKETSVAAAKSSQRQSKQNQRHSNASGDSHTAERGAGEQRKPPRDGCLICKGTHWARDCPTATAEQKAEVVQKLLINGVLDVPFCPDTGSDAIIIGRPVLEELRDLVANLPVEHVDPPVRVVVAGGSMMLCHEKVHINLQIVTAAGPLALTNIECLVLDANEEELLLGRTTLQSIDVDFDDVFERLAQQHIDAAEAEADDVPSDYVDVLGAEADAEVEPVLQQLVDEAVEAGSDAAHADNLRRIVVDYADIFRLRLGQDEPADVEPLEVRLEPGAEPYRSGARHYSEAQRQFLREYVRELEEAGLVVRNNQSRWSCPALPVAKGNSGEYRITIDCRPVNRKTIPLAGASPNLAVAMKSARDAYGLGAFDFHKGFWQMPLHPDSRGFFSFVTEEVVFTPTRVPQGATDSAVHFQAQMSDILKDLLPRSVLVWIDDVLLYARSAGDFLENLERFFAILRQRKLKLNAKKCKIFAKRVKWCGKLIDGEGVAHDHERLAALRQMPIPPTGAALQHFLCALNWLRDSMVDYARITATLQEKLKQVMRVRGRLKAQRSGASLDWNEAEAAAYRETLTMVERSCKLVFPDQAATVCMFTDASRTGHALVLTQVRRWQDDVPVEEQQHELLVCRGGLFKGAQQNWSIVEKEGYPIVKACGDLDYMLVREKGFHVYCDHSNMIRLFSPDHEVKQHVKGKLQRWALTLVGCRYVIHHIAGENSLWANIVPRWGQPAAAATDTMLAVKRVTTRSAQTLSELVHPRTESSPGLLGM